MKKKHSSQTELEILNSVRKNSKMNSIGNSFRTSSRLFEMPRSGIMSVKSERFFKSFTHKVCACVILGTNFRCAEDMRWNGEEYEGRSKKVQSKD